MFWGAICADGPVALVPVAGTMNATKYVNILQQHLVPFLDAQPLAHQPYIFQHDNAPCHKAIHTLAYLKTEGVEVLDSWPPYSPDLSIIENKMKLRRENIISKQQLQTRTMEIWDSPEIKELCSRLFSSIPTRLETCIHSKGGYTKY
jgi:hypothetical protein